MTRPALTVSRRTRSTPLTTRVEAAGVRAYTVYNHMLLATEFRGAAIDYAHLRRAVQVWDVGCERQVELVGPDAARLAQLLTVRDLRSFAVGQCRYAPVCDDDGHLLNDPVALRLAEDRFWFSVADSDIVLWAAGIARGVGLDVRVHEPEVWPLAVQGPRADDLMTAVFGEAARAIRFFGWAALPFQGHDLVVARSGWSSQGGFEVYVDAPVLAGELYDALMHAGVPYDVRPGCPNQIERIEAGLPSFGTDITREHTALEAGLERYCALDAPIEGHRSRRAAPPARRRCPTPGPRARDRRRTRWRGRGTPGRCTPIGSRPDASPLPRGPHDCAPSSPWACSTRPTSQQAPR